LPLEFEEFLLDPERRELRRGGTLVAVEPQVFDLIHYLVRNRDRVVTRDNLIVPSGTAGSCRNRRSRVASMLRGVR
jgi:DNA-binding response OmpR family regulator